jgi:hypothetical protein
MADDNIVRSYRSSGPARRVNAPAESAESRDAESTDGGSSDDATRGDPLSELARLIGQSDPFADSAQNGGQNRGRNSGKPPRRSRRENSRFDWRRPAAALAQESMRSPPLADPRHEEADSALSAADPYRTAPDDRFAQPARHAAPDDERDASARYRDEPHFGENHEGLRNAQPAETHEAHEAGDENYFLDGEAPADERFAICRGRVAVTASSPPSFRGCAMLDGRRLRYRTYYRHALGRCPDHFGRPDAKRCAGLLDCRRTSRQVRRTSQTSDRAAPEEPVMLPGQQSARARCQLG